MTKMAEKTKLRKGLAGLIAGLIAAIALLVLALPVMMQYQQHITESYQIKEYATMLEEQKEIEEKGLTSCYDPSTRTISINNTLGENVTIVLVYVSDGENEEIKYFQLGTLKITPGTNRISISDLGISLDSSRIKILKLVTARGTVLQPPYCNKVALVISEIALNVVLGFLGEEQAPGGLQSFQGIIYAHGFFRNYKDNGTHILINGTTVPDPTPSCPGSGGYPIAFKLEIKTEQGNIEQTFIRYEVGDYVIIVFSPLPYIIMDNGGCYNGACYEIKSKDDNTIYSYGYSYVSKYSDNDGGPLKYTLINNGYNYMIVGVELNNLEEKKGDDKDFYYNGTIYVSRTANVNYPDIVIEFFMDEKNIVTNASMHINGNVINATAFYRKQVKDKVSSQFGVYLPVEDLLGIEPGTVLYIKANVTYCNDSGCTTDEGEWISFTYNPLKLIINLIYRKYFGS